MRTGKTRICEKCGQVIQPGGMGGHLRLAHGIKIKTVVKQIRQVHNEVGEVSNKVGKVREVREQRPSDYVSKHSEVAEKRIQCWNCKQWVLEEDIHPASIQPCMKDLNVPECYKCFYIGRV
jgi:hypothetical protein